MKNKKNYIKQDGKRHYISEEEKVELFRKLREEKSPEKRRELENKLVMIYQGVITSVLKKINLHYLKYLSYDDMFSFGYQGLLRAIRDYDIERNTAKFITFAYIYIKNDIMHQISNQKTRKKRELSFDMEVDRKEQKRIVLKNLFYDGYQHGAPMPEYSPAAQEEINKSEREFIFNTMNDLLEDGKLDEMEYKVIMVKYNNEENRTYNHQEVGNVLGITREWVRVKHGTALKKIKSALVKADEYYNEFDKELDQ